jgi:hypothetical protein
VSKLVQDHAAKDEKDQEGSIQDRAQSPVVHHAPMDRDPKQYEQETRMDPNFDALNSRDGE